MSSMVSYGELKIMIVNFFCTHFYCHIVSVKIIKSMINGSSELLSSYFPFGFEGRMWDLIVSVPDHCLSFYFAYQSSCDCAVWWP